MKKLLLLLLCVLLIFSCVENKVNTLEEKIEYELSQEKEVNDLFLNFEFGDTEKEVNDKLRKLLLENKISQDINGEYIYEFTNFLMEGSSNEFASGIARFSFEYYEDKLYKLRLDVDPKERFHDIEYNLEEVNVDVGLVFHRIRDLYKEKYGTPLLTDNTWFEEYNNLHWIHGNRSIEIVLSLDITVEYLDLNIKSLLLNQNERYKNDIKENIQDDI